MKRSWMFVVLLYATSLPADELKTSQPVPSETVHVATALDHLTVLEFGEPVTMAAAGSAAFQIERHEDKVFIKPLKAGAATNLVVWTASRRFAYELAAPGEVKDMNFVVDSRTPAPAPASNASMEEIADMILSRALLGAVRVDSTGIKNEKRDVTVRIEHIFQARNAVYIHYSVRNQSRSAYHVPPPEVAELVPSRATISLVALQHTQLDRRQMRQLGNPAPRPLPMFRAEIRKEDIQPGEETHGIVVLREQVAVPTVMQLSFAARDGRGKIRAAVVF